MDALRDNKHKRKWSLLPLHLLEPAVEVLEYGAERYGASNWHKGHVPHEVLESLMRHLVCLMKGEQNDSESKKLHSAHIIVNAIMYQYSFDKVSTAATPTTPIFIDSFQRTFPGSDKIVFELTDGRQFDFTEKQLIELIINNKTS